VVILHKISTATFTRLDVHNSTNNNRRHPQPYTPSQWLHVQLSDSQAPKFSVRQELTAKHTDNGMKVNLLYF